MAEDRYVIKEAQDGRVEISKDVISLIAGMSALEAEGVSSIAGGVTAENIGKTDSRSLAKGIRIHLDETEAEINLALNLAYGVNIQETVNQVQERVKSTLISMVGLDVSDVNIKVIGVDAEA